MNTQKDLKAWKKEFYPTRADTRMSRIDAVRHSLRKWKGLLPENLDRYNLTVSFIDFALPVSGDSCALCQKYYDASIPDRERRCQKCPLAQVLGERCDCLDDGNDYVSPWHSFSLDKNPVPMIEALEKTLRELENA
jgi:hypothetical protein